MSCATLGCSKLTSSTPVDRVNSPLSACGARASTATASVVSARDRMGSTRSHSAAALASKAASAHRPYTPIQAAHAASGPTVWA